MGILQQAQDNLAKQRGVIGANQSRVAIAINNLNSSKENFAAAESRIRDADVAQEAANLIRTQESCNKLRLLCFLRLIRRRPLR